jgi:hypothetical protein
MRFAHILAVGALLGLATAPAIADLPDGGRGERMLLHPSPVPNGRVQVPSAAPPPMAKTAPVAASYCYAGPSSCLLYAPRNPGAPCACRSGTELYWGRAQ